MTQENKENYFDNAKQIQIYNRSLNSLLIENTKGIFKTMMNELLYENISKDLGRKTYNKSAKPLPYRIINHFTIHLFKALGNKTSLYKTQFFKLMNCTEHNKLSTKFADLYSTREFKRYLCISLVQEASACTSCTEFGGGE